MSQKKDLVQIIKDNPGCIFTVDNDCWWCNAAPPKPEAEMTDEEYDDWKDSSDLASSDDDLVEHPSGYGPGHLYGQGILGALAVIVGVKIKSV